MQILPVNREWTHTHLLEPFLEGSERLTRAWHGVDFHSLGQKPLSLKERAISWLIGMTLMIPLMNTVVWAAWKAFGNPEQLANPYCVGNTD